MTVIAILCKLHLGYGFLFFSEHEVHDDHDRSPEDNLLVPEEDLSKLEKPKGKANRADRDRPSEYRPLDHGICPNRHAAEVQEQRHDSAQLESPADGEENLEEPQEHKGGADHLPQDPHVVVASALLFIGIGRLCLRDVIFWRLFSQAHGHTLKCLLSVSVCR